MTKQSDNTCLNKLIAGQNSVLLDNATAGSVTYLAASTGKFATGTFLTKVFMPSVSIIYVLLIFPLIIFIFVLFFCFVLLEIADIPNQKRILFEISQGPEIEYHRI